MCGSRVARLAIQPEPPDDVLDVDDRVIHHFTQRDDQTGEHHGVDDRATLPEDERGREQR